MHFDIIRKNLTINLDMEKFFVVFHYVGTVSSEQR